MSHINSLENTIAAFDNAVKVGADFLEMDVHYTKDKQIVVRILKEPQKHFIGTA